MCYRELTLIVEKSSREKAQWIEKTIIAEKLALGGTRYCLVLELVKETVNTTGKHPQKESVLEKK